MSIRIAVPVLLCVAAAASPLRAENLQVHAEPNVRIFVDGRFRGVTTAADRGLFVRGLEPGQHQVHAVKDGFETQVVVVTLEEGDAAASVDIPARWIPRAGQAAAARPARAPHRRPPHAGQPGSLAGPARPKLVQLGPVMAGSLAFGRLAGGYGSLEGGLYMLFRPWRFLDFGFKLGVGHLNLDHTNELTHVSGTDTYEISEKIRHLDFVAADLLLRGLVPLGSTMSLAAGTNLGLGQPLTCTAHSSGDGNADTEALAFYKFGFFFGPEFYLGRTFTLGFLVGCEFLALAFDQDFRFDVGYSTSESIRGVNTHVFVRLHIGFRFG